MQRHEYKVVPAPRRGTKSREAKSHEDRFALTLSNLMNELGRDGWEYVRSETLPTEERAGFMKTRVVEQTMLIFRRAMDRQAVLGATLTDAAAPKAIVADAPAPRLGPAVEPPPGNAPALRAE